jgi:hypothetical protein
VLPRDDGAAAAALPGVATPDEVVAEALADLANGPTWFAGEQVREGAQRLSAVPRSEAVRMMLERVSVMDAPDGAGDGASGAEVEAEVAS